MVTELDNIKQNARQQKTHNQCKGKNTRQDQNNTEMRRTN